MGIRIRLDLIVFHTTDRAIHFQHGQRDIMDVRNAVLAQRALQFVHADVFFGHLRFVGLSVVNQKAGFALNRMPKSLALTG